MLPVALGVCERLGVALLVRVAEALWVALWELVGVVEGVVEGVPVALGDSNWLGDWLGVRDGLHGISWTASRSAGLEPSAVHVPPSSSDTKTPPAVAPNPATSTLLDAGECQFTVTSDPP